MPVQRPLVSVAIVDAHGAAFASASHRGQTFVAGERGERYSLAVTNNSARRIEIVVTVDGRDVVSGKRGDFRKQRGYVIDPFRTVTIDGFRQSLASVATFRFSGVADSYAARRGSARSVGVIGVAAFEEKVRPPMRHKDRHRRHSAPSSAEAGKSAGRSAPRQDLGTEYGESRRSDVREVSFVRANSGTPSFRTAVFYDSERGLAARGITMQPQPIELEHRDPWPALDPRFAPPP